MRYLELMGGDSVKVDSISRVYVKPSNHSTYYVTLVICGASEIMWREYRTYDEAREGYEEMMTYLESV